MEKVAVALSGGDAYRISVRGHEFTVDQPPEAGGEGLGPAPVDLFVASLASCVGFYAGRYLARHGLPREGLRVETEYEMTADRPARVGEVRLRVVLPQDVGETRARALAAVVEHCTVHNSLRQPPRVDIVIG
ncbi:OsmC family protein [Streptomyces verrucosisporus]|uniref:OsmC family protein n=1 Tax=Streptomyces verrucosisporus TaxID=1695161 RepID=UPI001F12616E|nr:OsmC family protein [Streptomyces verrucosisporus]MBN3929597.1 OsmC family protein [Streptomyces verrucosisporus]